MFILYFGHTIFSRSFRCMGRIRRVPARWTIVPVAACRWQHSATKRKSHNKHKPINNDGGFFCSGFVIPEQGFTGVEKADDQQNEGRHRQEKEYKGKGFFHKV